MNEEENTFEIHSTTPFQLAQEAARLLFTEADYHGSSCGDDGATWWPAIDRLLAAAVVMDGRIPDRSIQKILTEACPEEERARRRKARRA